MAKVASLWTSLSLDHSNFSSGLRKSVAESATAAKRIEGHLNTIVTAGKAIVGGAVAGEVFRIARAGLDYASSLGEVSQQLGVTSRDLQLYRHIATQVGISQEDMDKSLAKLTLTMGKARDGSKSQVELFKSLGGAVEGAVASGKSAGEVMPLLADALARISDPAKRAKIEVEAFGKTGQKLDTLLAGGGKAIHELADAAERAGVVLSSEQIQNADDAADKLAAVQQVLQANIAGAVANNTDAILALANALAQIVVNAGRAVEAYTNWRNVVGANGGDINAAISLTRTKSGRDTLLNDIDGKMRQNVADRAKGRGNRRSFLGIDITSPATAKDNARLDREYQALVRQRNAVLKIDANASRVRPVRPATGVLAVDDNGAAARKAGGAAKAAATKAEREAEQAAREAERAAEEARRNDLQFQDDLGRSRTEFLGLRQQLTSDAREQAQLEHEMLDLATEERNRDIENRVVDGELSRAQADRLRLEGRQNDEQRAAIINRELDRKLEQEALDLKLAGINDQRDLLSAQSNLARTAGERRELELRILDLAYQEERARLEAVIASKASTDAEKEIAKNRLALLGQLQGSAEAGVRKGTMGPLEAYLDSIPKGAAEINEALDGIAADGLKSFNDGLADAIMGSKSLGDVFKNVANSIISDLIRMAVQQSITGLFGKSGGGLGSIVGTVGGFLGIGGSSFATGLSSNITGQGAIGNFSTPVSIPDVPGWANGGSGRLGGFGGIDRNMLSLNGMPIARVSKGEMLRIDPVNDRGGGRGPTNIYMNGVMTVEDFWGRIQAMDAETGMGAVSTTERRATRRQQRRLGRG